MSTRRRDDQIVDHLGGVPPAIVKRRAQAATKLFQRRGRMDRAAIQAVQKFHRMAPRSVQQDLDVGHRGPFLDDAHRALDAGSVCSLPAVSQYTRTRERPRVRVCIGGELRKEQPLRIPRAAPLLQPERGRARRRGLIRTLVDTFRNDIRDQEVRIH